MGQLVREAVGAVGQWTGIGVRYCDIHKYIFEEASCSYIACFGPKNVLYVFFTWWISEQISEQKVAICTEHLAEGIDNECVHS